MNRQQAAAQDLRPPGRVMGRLVGAQPGPTLIAIGAVHGNEPAGVAAMQQVMAHLQAKQAVARGEFIGLIGNLAALTRNCRFVDRDLNRNWQSDRISGIHRGPASDAVEDHEQFELLAELRSAFARARGDVYVLDLHTTSGAGKPFTVFGDTLRSRRFARRFPCPLILGLEEHLEGTLIDYLTGSGHVAVAIEGGQHVDPEAIDNLEAALWIALDTATITDRALCPPVDRLRNALAEVSQKLPVALEIQVRHAVGSVDRFRMHPGFASFDLVSEGQLLGRDRDGEVVAPRDGLLLMPLYQEQGDDGFFIVTPVAAYWLTLSQWLRQGRTDRIVHWLPGVKRHPDHRDYLIVNRRIARFFALEVLHLLGYRLVDRDGDRLVVRRRKHDEP